MSTQRPENSPFVLIIRDGWGTNPFPEQAEYDGLPDALMGEAIDECRRQEQQQRSLELERAWASAREVAATVMVRSCR